jgi:hypothetical protein
MSISGNLKTMELSELLQWVAQGHKNGSLEIDNGRVQKKIYFREGKIIASASNDPREFLGHFLVSRGFITEEELAKAMEMQSSSKMLLGKILVTLGAITEEQLQAILVAKTEESIYDVFSWNEGEFQFIDEEALQTGLVPMALDVTHLVLEGINRLDERRRVEQVIPDVDSVIPVTLGDLPLDEVSAAEAKILREIDDEKTVREICMHTHASEFHVSQVLFRHYQAKRLKLIRIRRPSGAQPTLQEGGSRSLPLVNAEALIDAAQQSLEEEKFSRALRSLRAALSLEPENEAIRTTLKEAEERIEAALAAEGLTEKSVPVIARPVEELTRLDVAPEEAFVLSRINGSYDLGSLIKISPMGSLDARLVLHRLLQAGHIELR